MKEDVSGLKGSVAGLDAGYERLGAEVQRIGRVVDAMDGAIVGQFQMELRKLRKELRGALIDWSDMGTRVLEYAVRLMGDYRDRYDLYHRPMPCS